jgi:ADP-heptose:LPS heptosyltransferase
MLEENSSLVESLGGRRSTLPPSLPVPAPERDIAEAHLLRAGAIPGELRIAVHPGGYYPSQRYPLERFARAAAILAERHGGRVVVLGGPADRELSRALYRASGSSAVQVPTGNVMHLASVLHNCDLLLANNSGPVHLAGAVGLPTVSVMGPTDPVRFTPGGPLNRVLRRNDLPCSPCSRGECGSHECLLGISEDSLVRAAETMIGALYPQSGNRRSVGGGA